MDIIAADSKSDCIYSGGFLRLVAIRSFRTADDDIGRYYFPWMRIRFARVKNRRDGQKRNTDSPPRHRASPAAKGKRPHGKSKPSGPSELRRDFGADIPSILIIAFAALLLCWPTLNNEALHHGSDVSFHVTWAKGFIESFGDGNLYPRWDANINRALGGPVFVFYAPLGYYLLALVNLIARDVLLSFRIVFVLAGFLAGFSFYRFARHYSSTFWATLGAAAYVLLPYHALDLYDRFAFAEYLAFFWIPVLFSAIRRLVIKRTGRAWPLLAVSLAGLLFTHILTAFMALLVAIPYGLLLLIHGRSWKSIAPLIGSGLLGAACAAVYIIPAMAERGQVHIELNTELEFGRWDRHFLFTAPDSSNGSPQLIRPLVGETATRQIVLMLAGAVLLAGICRRSRSFSGTFEPWLFLGLAVWTIFLQLVPASPLWRYLPGLKMVQFPWRFLLFHSFTVSALIAHLGPAAAELHREPVGSRNSRWLIQLTRPGIMAALIIIALLPGAAYTLDLHSIRPFTYSESRSQSPLYLNRMVREYIPSTIPDWEYLEEFPLPSVFALVEPEGGSVKILRWRPQHRAVEIDAAVSSKLQLWTFYYPGWSASLDGAPVEVFRSSLLSMIEIAVPPGRHRVQVDFRATKVRRIAALVSLAAVMVFAGIVIVGRLSRNHPLPQKRSAQKY